MVYWYTIRAEDVPQVSPDLELSVALWICQPGPHPICATHVLRPDENEKLAFLLSTRLPTSYCSGSEARLLQSLDSCARNSIAWHVWASDLLLQTMVELFIGWDTSPHKSFVDAILPQSRQHSDMPMHCNRAAGRT